MAGIVDIMEVVAKRRIFEVSFDDYVGTVNGLFNFLEIAVAKPVEFQGVQHCR